MRLPLLLLGLSAHFLTALATISDLTDRTTVYIQPLSASLPVPLASISYNPSTLSATLLSFEAPDFPTDSNLARIGIYDPDTASWRSATTVTSARTFARGFRPTIVLSLDANGNVLGAACKSAPVDAGQTRDFAPGVKVVGRKVAGGPELNRPVVLTKEGKVEEAVPEKTFLQK